jgi:malonyl-CoA O-methyltransferase
MSQTRRPAPVDIQTGYALWANTYPPYAHNSLMQLEESSMLALLPMRLDGTTGLDLACGSGRYLRHLQRRGATEMVGVDISAAMLANAAGWKRVKGDLNALPFANDRVDIITCGLAVGHSASLVRIIENVARVLRPGGTMIYSDLHPAAALTGWQRTFSAADGHLYQLEHHIHSLENHYKACLLAGLNITAILEPSLTEAPSREAARLPAILAIRVVKQCA